MKQKTALYVSVLTLGLVTQAQADSSITLYQADSYNNAFISQTGDNNTFAGKQDGVSNTLTSVQVGLNAGRSNKTSIEQINYGNHAESRQYGAGNETSITQLAQTRVYDYAPNRAIVNLGQSSAPVERNKVSIEQSSESNFARVDVYRGGSNDVILKQENANRYNEFFESSVNTAQFSFYNSDGNAIYAEQRNGNLMNVRLENARTNNYVFRQDQRVGDFSPDPRNRLYFTSTADFSKAVLSQTGIANVANVAQHGISNTIYLLQEGNNNTATLYQGPNAFNNTISLAQLGTHQNATIIQN